MTTPSPVLAAADGTSPSALRRTRRVVVTLLLVTLLTQRLAVPVGAEQVPLSLPLVLLVLLLALASGSLELDPTAVRLYALAMGAAVAATLIVLALGISPSLLSLAFLLSIYLIAVVRSPVQGQLLTDGVHRVYLDLMTLAALVSLVQFLVQSAVPYEDYLALLVPERWLLIGYHTGDPLVYGSELHRTNAVLFLEPSFLGYFLGAAVVLAVGRRASVLRICLLVAGAVPTLAGNVLAVMLPGLLVLALSRHRGGLVKVLPALLVGVAIALATPLGALYLGRTGELGGGGGETSSNLRLVAPYQLLLPAWTDSPQTLLVGNGAGASTDVIGAKVADLAVITPAVPKLLVEYGILGALPVLGFLAWVLLRGARGRPWTIGLVIGFIVVNAGLLQVTFALGTILLLRLVPPLPARGRPTPGGAEPLPAERTPAVAGA